MPSRRLLTVSTLAAAAATLASVARRRDRGAPPPDATAVDALRDRMQAARAELLERR
jgi:hypothetical protein